MIQVWLRLAMWVAVFVIGFLVFGPQLFDQTRSANPVGSHKQLFLPPARSERELALQRLDQQHGLNAQEQAELATLRGDREARFWQGDGLSVEQALDGVETQRKAHLAGLLQQRGLTAIEAGVFMMAVERDYPRLLEDRE